MSISNKGLSQHLRHRRRERRYLTPVKTLVTDRFLNLYGSPDCVNPSAFVAEYHRALDGTDPSFLRKAISLIVDRHAYRNWPTVGECRDMVNTVAARVSREREKQAVANAPAPDEEHPTAEMRARVKALVADATKKIRADERDAIDARLADIGASIDWGKVSKDAWDKRMEESALARFLALPKVKEDSAS